ncbi:SDR family NAD(P)-dependent oxidoreductase [Moheibacter lacus]|uniref:SDR family NAD(P)-dependent oxidoreductase n=1 Tax=Moheibacter lacus TaxID=2745851 RepID=A0A838ZSB8_9FLAO|nr:SDR family NAD(P)-dependent oxidoreductase [Moheibacter lacus]MBA5629339.1 SDR family NAD(P)-dependent oxidoreductase [Moheibacter lacus]
MNKKIIVITGSSSGIGETLANHFVKQGHTVYGLSRSKKEKLAFHHIATDVTDKENVFSSIQTIINEAGRIDVLINNAGVGMLGSIEDVRKEDFDKLVNVNIYGVIYLMQAVLPLMRGQKSGHILNVSSIASNHGLPFRGYYSASKSAIDRITESVRLENQNTGIEITTVNFGDIKTPIAESRIQSTVSNYYKKSYEKLVQLIDEEVDHGLEPEQLIPVIERLINKRNLKPHYNIGKGIQKFSVTLKRVLGQRVFEKMLARYSKLE